MVHAIKQASRGAVYLSPSVSRAEKLDIHNTAGLVRYSIRHGVIEP